MPTCIKEERFFNVLQCIFPVQAGVVVSMLLGENLFADEDFTTMLFYSYCSRISCSWQKMKNDIGIGHLIGSIVTYCVIGLGFQLAIFVREKQIEKQQTARVWSVSYNNNNGVRIASSDSNSNISTTSSSSNSNVRVLWKHHRNVISPYASLVSFLVCQVYALVIIYLFLEIGPLGPAVFFQFLHFIIFFLFFFPLSLIETVFSPTLLDSLIPCRKRKYQAVTV